MTSRGLRHVTTIARSKCWGASGQCRIGLYSRFAALTEPRIRKAG